MFGLKKKYKELSVKYDELHKNYMRAEGAVDALLKTHERHAKWITEVKDYATSDSVFARKVCSDCGGLDCVESFKREDWENYNQYRWKPTMSKYCKYCGAKMDLEEE